MLGPSFGQGCKEKELQHRAHIILANQPLVFDSDYTLQVYKLKRKQVFLFHFKKL